MTRRTWIPEILVQSMDRLEERLDHPWSLEEMADLACFSPFHFHRIFRRALGSTPFDFLERLRLERAALMLLAGEKSILKLAMSVGFRRGETFARRFRARFGVSAREYRSRQLELWRKLGLEAGEDPLGHPGEISVVRLPAARIEVRRSLGEDEGFDFGSADSPWRDRAPSGDPVAPSGSLRIGASLDWSGITPPGLVRQDWGRSLDGRRLSEGWVARTVGGRLYATLSVKGAGPVPPLAYQRLFVWSMAGRHRLSPGAILEIQRGDRIVVHQPVTDHGEG